VAVTPPTELVEKAHHLVASHQWRAAYDLLADADGRQPLPTEGLELLADAAWWTGQMPLAIEARERAFTLATRNGDPIGAAQAAIELGRDNLLRFSMPVATGWIRRAEAILKDAPENAGHGWLAAIKGFQAALTGKVDEGIDFARYAEGVADRLAERDLAAYAMGIRAALLVARGDVDEGIALADEAALQALSGDLQPQVAGGVCCATIEACTAIGDVQRAAEWTEAQDRWCRREGINGFPGMCRLFRSGVKTLHGAWPEAEAEARVASDELRGYIPAAAGLALVQIGEIRLYRGDLPAAEEALLGAHRFGQDIQPAHALLLLAQGKASAAAAELTQSLEEPHRQASWLVPPGSGAQRLRLLPARIEVALELGDLDTARAAADELDQLAVQFKTIPARASAAACRGAMLLAEGEYAAAAQRLREGIDLWTEVNAPYESARARVALAAAYVGDGATERALLELRAARDSFEELGAQRAQRAAEQQLQELRGTSDQPMGTARARTTRAFMFTDIVDSTRLAETLGDEAWDRIERWHDRVIRAAAAEHGGEEVKATGDGFFLAFPDADGAIAAAVQMQRRLAAHRQDAGFAPQVRIGIHLAEANRVGLDYAGAGVNQASRIGDAAGADEILVSAATLAASRRPVGEAERRTVELKGITAPVEVVSVQWR
jgi:class 3 adenylate cyclase